MTGTITSNIYAPVTCCPVFKFPGGVALDQSSGNVFVSDTYKHHIQKLTNIGGIYKIWGNKGTGNGEFNYPEGIDVDPSGSVFVTDMMNHRIQKFSNTGTFLTSWGGKGKGNYLFNHPSDVATDADSHVFVADMLFC